MAALLKSECKLFVSVKAKQFAGAYDELEKASGWNGRSWLCLLPSRPSKEISTLGSILRSSNVRGYS